VQQPLTRAPIEPWRRRTASGRGTFDGHFLAGPRSRAEEARELLRIGAEFVRGFRRLHPVGPCVTVFGSARFGEDHVYYQMARELGRLLARAGFTIMTGGGPGIMEAANRGGKEGGGISVGMNIVLPQEQRLNQYVDVWMDFDYFFIRKVMLIKYSYAFVVLPGGYGTLDEIYDAATLIQTGKIGRFPIVIMGARFWAPLLDFMQSTMVTQGTIAQADVDRFLVTDSPEEATRHILTVATDSLGLRWEPDARRRRQAGQAR
jgi:uncharacterized protein (TIGR00730 family)